MAIYDEMKIDPDSLMGSVPSFTEKMKRPVLDDVVVGFTNALEFVHHQINELNEVLQYQTVEAEVASDAKSSNSYQTRYESVLYGQITELQSVGERLASLLERLRA